MADQELSSKSWSEFAKRYRRHRAAIDAAGDLGDEAVQARVQAAAEKALDNALRHLPEHERDDPRMRSAARFAILVGRPIPDSLEAALRTERTDKIEAAKVNFTRTGNPMYAFEASVWARSGNDPRPAWVEDYLDQAIYSFWLAYEAFLFGRAPNKAVQALAVAFRVYRGKGKETVWDKGSDVLTWEFGDEVMELASTWSLEWKNYNVSSLIGEAIKRPTEWRDWPRSKSSGWDYWHKFESYFPHRVEWLREMPGFVPERRGRRRKQGG